MTIEWSDTQAPKQCGVTSQHTEWQLPTLQHSKVHLNLLFFHTDCEDVFVYQACAMSKHSTSLQGQQIDRDG